MQNAKILVLFVIFLSTLLSRHNNQVQANSMDQLQNIRWALNSRAFIVREYPTYIKQVGCVFDQYPPPGPSLQLVGEGLHARLHL